MLQVAFPGTQGEIRLSYVAHWSASYHYVYCTVSELPKLHYGALCFRRLTGAALGCFKIPREPTTVTAVDYHMDTVLSYLGLAT